MQHIIMPASFHPITIDAMQCTYHYVAVHKKAVPTFSDLGNQFDTQMEEALKISFMNRQAPFTETAQEEFFSQLTSGQFEGITINRQQQFDLLCHLRLFVHDGKVSFYHPKEFVW